jgi:hypothetical protein
MERNEPSMTQPDVAYDKVREICLGFPGADEKLSWGAPTFHVRGRMFVMYGDGEALVKATLGEQKKLVASDPDRFYVPKYFGVKGWVGVRLERGKRKPDYIELAILAEEAYRSVAPPSVVRSGAIRPAATRPPPKRAVTDPIVAKQALERLTAICLELPGAAAETEGRFATFRAKEKAFAYFLDNHHGDGIIGACVKGEKKNNAKLLKADPRRFYAPAYRYSSGWLGVRLDGKKVDWKDVAERVKASYGLNLSPARRARR